MKHPISSGIGSGAPLPREGGRYPVPSVGERALTLYRELHETARLKLALPPYCAVPTRANRDQGMRALVGDRVLVLEFTPTGLLVLREESLREESRPEESLPEESLQPGAFPTDK